MKLTLNSAFKISVKMCLVGTLLAAATSAAQAAASQAQLSEAISALNKNQASQAIQLSQNAIKALQKSKSANLDLALITLARAQYQAGQLTAAQQTYSKIDKSSDRWLQAVEERAHAKAKAGDYNKAIADLTTLMSPVFEKLVGPEAYFIQALTYHRLCQYGKVVETLEKFKANMKPRAAALVAVANGNSNSAINEAAQALIKNGNKGLSYAKLAPQLPSVFHLDYQVQANLKNKPALYRRLAQLAEEDLAEISAVTKKLHLVEAELMQQLHIAEKSKDENRHKIGQFKSGSGQLVFPYNGEVWLDEVDHYQAQAQSCPTSKGSKKL